MLDPKAVDLAPPPTLRQTLRLSLRRAAAMGALVGVLGLLLAGWRGALVALVVGPVFGLLDVIERLARGEDRSFGRHVLGAAAGWLVGFATVPFVNAQVAYTNAVAQGATMDEAWGAASDGLDWLTHDLLTGAVLLTLLATPCAVLVFVRARGLRLWEQLLLPVIGAALLFGVLSPFTTLAPRGTLTTGALATMITFGTLVFAVAPIVALAVMDRLEGRARRPDRLQSGP